MTGLHADRTRAESFGAVADQYDRSRPPYPAQLIDDLTGGGAPDVLDVGCGTGIASRAFLARGCQVLGVEPDGRMAAIARQRGVTVEIGRFEEWAPAGRTFDLVVSAQAWHWVHPEVGVAKAAGVTRPGGRIGLFWNRGAHPPALQAALDEVYARFEPPLGRGYADPVPDQWFEEDAARAVESLRADPGWAGAEIRSYTHVRPYTTAAWLEQLPTHSDHQLLPPERLADLLDAVGAAVDDFGGSFDMTFTTTLACAVRGG